MTMTAVKVEGAPVGLRFWVLWMLATTAGLLAYTFASFLLMFFSQVIGVGDGGAASIVFGLVLSVVGGALLGAAFGVGQWLVLRRELGRAGWWVLATILGYAVATILTPAIITELGWVAAIKGVLIYGGVLGIFQWYVLRGRVHRAEWWVAISVVAWGAGIILSNALFNELSIPAVFFITTALTGGGMVWLLRRRASQSSA